MKHLLFVCTGNTCRSPLAEYLLRDKAGERYEVRSAGLAALPGQQASEQVIRLLDERGITVEHRSQPITADLMDWADLILTMTEAHAAVLKEQYPERAAHIYTLKMYSDPTVKEPDIADPFGGDRAIYEQTAEEIETWLDRFLERDGTQ